MFNTDLRVGACVLLLAPCVGTGCTCVDDADCTPGTFCDNTGQCADPMPDGHTCSLGSECLSGLCIDGFCCDSGCGASCDSCNIAGSEGTCSVTAAGSSGNPSCSPYLCDGVSTGCPTSCVSSADCGSDFRCDDFNLCVDQKVNSSTCSGDVECLSGFCIDGFCCGSACGDSCDACNNGGLEGTCITTAQGSPGSPSCSPYLCDGAGTVCPSFCTSSADCASDFYCDGANLCVDQKVNGSTCQFDVECLSNNCVGGFCN